MVPVNNVFLGSPDPLLGSLDPTAGLDERMAMIEAYQKKLAELKEELFNLRFQLAVNQLDNPTRIKAVKKDIARIKTIQRQREIAANN